MPSPAEVLKQEYKAKPDDCSGYFKKVARRLHVSVPEKNADGLIDYILGNPRNWVSIGKGPQSGIDARGFAARGYFVVALLKAKDHYPYKFNKKTGEYDIPHAYHSGHLAIVVDTPSADYPYVICGSTDPNGKSDGTKKVYEEGKVTPWRKIDAPNVMYYRYSEVLPSSVE